MNADFSLRLRDRTVVTSRQLEIGLLAGIVLVAAVLRFYKLGEWSFWIDEIYTLNRVQAHYSSLATAWYYLPPNTNWVPVSLLLTAGVFESFGIDEWSARLAPALLGIVTVPLLFVPIRRYFGVRTALLFALLLALAPWHLQWSQNARFYTALVLFYNLALFSLYWGLEEDRPAAILLGFAFLYLALSERILGFFLIPVIASYVLCLWLLPFARPAGWRRRNLLLLALPVLAGLLIEGLSRLTAGGSRFFGDFGGFVGNPIDSPVRILILIFFAIGLPLVAVAPFSASWLLRQRSRAGLLVAIGATVPVIMLLALSPSLFVVERYALITLPAWLLLAAVALERLAAWLTQQGRWLALALAAIFVADALGAYLMYYQLNNGNRPDWRGAFHYVESQKAAEDLIVAPWPEIGHYYLGEEHEILSLNEIVPAELESGDRRVWFVVDSEAVWFAGRNKQWMEENAELLFVWYLRMREQIDMKVYRYDPPGFSAG